MLTFGDALTAGLPIVLQADILAFAILGTVIGLVVGALPGLSSAMAVAVMIPLTYSLSPEQAFALLLPAYAAGTFGGSLAAILLNIPGTGAAIMTAFDGHPMAARGEAGRAIGLATAASLFGGLLSAVLLAAAAPAAALWAIRLGAHEYFAVAIFGLAIIAFISASLLKGLLSAAFGLLIACVGTDPSGGYPRFIFGQAELIAGLSFVPVMVGLLGLAELFHAVERESAMRPPIRQRLRGLGQSLHEAVRLRFVALRSAIIGLAIGLMPGSGPTVGSVIAYGAQRRIGARGHEPLGQGAPEGIVAAEAANNGGTGGALVPMMALGIPGDAVTAVLIGALLLHGLQPGPALFLQQPDLVSAMFLLFIIGNILFAVLALMLLPLLVRILQTPTAYLFPVVFALCIIGAYAASNSLFDVGLVIAFGVIGYVMRRLSIPVAPMVLGFVLGPLVEDNLRRALILDDGSIFGFFERPVSGTLLLLAAAMIISPLVRHALRRADNPRLD